jgi:hypothetical protein
MELEDIQGKKYPGYGRCIYCGCRGEKYGLRGEHIIPFSLGGNAEIENASCKRCEGITSYLDGYLGRHIYNEYRSHAGVQSREPKKRPKSFPARIVVDENEEIRHLSRGAAPMIMQILRAVSGHGDGQQCRRFADAELAR